MRYQAHHWLLVAEFLQVGVALYIVRIDTPVPESKIQTGAETKPQNMKKKLNDVIPKGENYIFVPCTKSQPRGGKLVSLAHEKG